MPIFIRCYYVICIFVFGLLLSIRQVSAENYTFTENFDYLNDNIWATFSTLYGYQKEDIKNFHIKDGILYMASSSVLMSIPFAVDNTSIVEMEWKVQPKILTKNLAYSMVELFLVNYDTMYFNNDSKYSPEKPYTIDIYDNRVKANNS